MQTVQLPRERCSLVWIRRNWGLVVTCIAVVEVGRGSQSPHLYSESPAAPVGAGGPL